jgi:localization factor PodJL
VVALAGDLKSLEDLTRRSDERNTKTFEAIHDTLLKIVDRLGSLEDNRSRAPAELPRKLALADAPSIEPSDALPIANDLPPPVVRRDVRDVTALKRSPAEAAAQAAVAAMDETIEKTEEPSGRVRSMLGGLSRAFAKKEKPQPQAKTEPTLPGMAGEAPTTELDRPLDQPLDPKIANQPLEPGSGAPDLNAIMRRVRDERGQPRSGNDAAKSDFIAAARRAAQAAAAEAQVTKKTADLAGTARNRKIGDLLLSKRKPIMVGAIVVLLALAGLQLGKAFFNDGAEIAAGEPAIEPMIEDPTTATGEEIADTERPVRMADAPADDAAEGRAQETMSLQGPETANAAGFEAVKADEMVETTDSVPAGDEAVAAQTEDPAAAPETTAAVTTQPVEEAKAGDAAKPAIVTEAVPAEAGPVMLREAADAGDPKAMFEVGSRYAEGRGGLKTDMKTAAKWYERAAELGLAPAQYRIGNLYEKGNGVARDLAKAKTWYQMAAEQGNASAMHNLAVLFATGADGTTDNNSAARWFGQAAELGVKDSQFNLGILSARGVGMPQNLEESYKWFALVAKTGDRDAAAKRDDIAKALRPEQLTNARAATELWKAKPVNAETNTVSVPDAWRESEDAKTASIDMKKAIRNIQAILNKNGYDAGSADGVMGAKTKEAIAAFQRANGMDATGEIDEKLVRKLLEKK